MLSEKQTNKNQNKDHSGEKLLTVTLKGKCYQLTPKMVDAIYHMIIAFEENSAA